MILFAMVPELKKICIYSSVMKISDYVIAASNRQDLFRNRKPQTKNNIVNLQRDFCSKNIIMFHQLNFDSRLFIEVLLMFPTT